MKLFILILTALTLNLTAQAHEGHDHEGAKNVQAPKGGVIKHVDDIYIEITAKKQDIKIYFYNLELKPISTSEFNLTAKIKVPKSSKTEALVLNKKTDVIEATYDAKKLHRYDIVVEFEHIADKHKDKLTFTVEPKK